MAIANHADILICSESPSAAWLSSRRLQHRLDASYYSANYLPLDTQLDEKPDDTVVPLRELLKSPRRVLYQNTATYDRTEKPPRAVPFISGVDLDSTTLSVNWDSVRFVDGWMTDQYPRGLLFPGSLLIKVKGPNQSAVFVERCHEPALVSGTIFFAGVRRADPYYLAAYLASETGTRWRTRLRTNITVEFVGNDELKEVPIYLPEEAIQKAIGNKVRKAERLRELAEAARRTASNRLDDLLRWPISLRESSTNYVNPSDASVQRLDAKFYLPAYLDTAKHIRSLKSGWRPLSDYIRSVYNGAEFREFEAEGRPYLCVANMADGFLDVGGAPKISWNAELPNKALIQEGDLLIVRTGSLGQAADVRPVDAATNAAISSHFIRLVLDDPSLAAVLAFFLNSAPGRLLQEQIAYGAIQLQLSQDEVGELPVPNFSSEAAESIGGGYRCWRDRLDESRALTTAAKQAVKSLIDGTLDSDRLLAESTEIGST